LRRPDFGGAVGQYQRANLIHPFYGQPLGDQTAHGNADNYAITHVQSFQQPFGIADQGTH
jgi:hypothetical protein